MLTLYGESNWDSPWVFTAYVALWEKSLEFDVQILELSKGQSRTEHFRERSLTSRVPTLIHDGFQLSESSAIVEYLDEAFPAPEHPRLLPETLRERARARQIMAWLRTDLQPLRDERPTTTVFWRANVAPLGDAARAARDKLVFVCERLLPESGDSPFSEPCIVDAELALALHRLILNGDEVPARVERWARGVWQRPSVRAFVERERPSQAH